MKKGEPDDKRYDGAVEHHIGEIRRAYTGIGSSAERNIEDNTAEAIAVFVEKCCEPANTFSKSLVASIRAGHWKVKS